MNRYLVLKRPIGELDDWEFMSDHNEKSDAISSAKEVANDYKDYKVTVAEIKHLVTMVAQVEEIK